MADNHLDTKGLSIEKEGIETNGEEGRRES